MFFSFTFCTFFKKSKSVSFSRVYVCVKAKLRLVIFFTFFLCTFPLTPNKKRFKTPFCLPLKNHFENRTSITSTTSEVVSHPIFQCKMKKNLSRNMIHILRIWSQFNKCGIHICPHMVHRSRGLKLKDEFNTYILSFPYLNLEHKVRHAVRG